ncbi:MAG: radical SAM protein [Candidatus Firestonebacteria bacterium]|nr:radical SAM protein [Candidatus Firestonebacteria bacterium]
MYLKRSVSDIIDEIEFYYTEYHLSHIAFYDDALLFDSSSHIETLMDLLILRKIDINFYTPNGLHSRFITQSLAIKMKKTGFRELRLSLETSNPLLQINTGGKISNIEFIKSINYLKEAGFEPNDIGVYIMVGLPEQKYEDIIQTIDFVQKENIKIKLINFSPIPGTKEWTKISPDLRKILDIEPLWQNDIAYLMLARYIDWDKNQELKNIVNNKPN